jgi:L-asparaginase/Glu-tRNA(Gln) amidotransferase subunit D
MKGYSNHLGVGAWVPLLLCITAVAAEPGKPPNVMMLATGGTIAGTGASSTQFSDYQAAKMAVQGLQSVAAMGAERSG